MKIVMKREKGEDREKRERGENEEEVGGGEWNREKEFGKGWSGRNLKRQRETYKL